MIDNRENQSQPDSQSQGNETTPSGRASQDNNTPQPANTNEASTQPAPQAAGASPENAQSFQSEGGGSGNHNGDFPD